MSSHPAAPPWAALPAGSGSSRDVRVWIWIPSGKEALQTQVSGSLGWCFRVPCCLQGQQGRWPHSRTPVTPAPLRSSPSPGPAGQPTLPGAWLRGFSLSASFAQLRSEGLSLYSEKVFNHSAILRLCCTCFYAFVKLQLQTGSTTHATINCLMVQIHVTFHSKRCKI